MLSNYRPPFFARDRELPRHILCDKSGLWIDWTSLWQFLRATIYVHRPCQGCLHTKAHRRVDSSTKCHPIGATCRPCGKPSKSRLE